MTQEEAKTLLTQAAEAIFREDYETAIKDLKKIKRKDDPEVYAEAQFLLSE